MPPLPTEVEKKGNSRSCLFWTCGSMTVFIFLALALFFFGGYKLWKASDKESQRIAALPVLKGILEVDRTIPTPFSKEEVALVILEVNAYYNYSSSSRGGSVRPDETVYVLGEGASLQMDDGSYPIRGKIERLPQSNRMASGRAERYFKGDGKTYPPSLRGVSERIDCLLDKLSDKQCSHNLIIGANFAHVTFTEYYILPGDVVSLYGEIHDGKIIPMQ